MRQLIGKWDEVLSKDIFQALLIAIGIGTIGYVLFGLSVIESIVWLLFGFIGQLAMKANELKKEAEKRNKLLICLSPLLMNKTVMLIHGGMHPQTSLIETFDEMRGDTAIGGEADRFVNDLRTGMTLEGAVLTFNLKLQYKPLGRMLKRITLYEKTGNQLLLTQLDQDLLQLNEEKYNYLMQEMNAADLFSMIPSMIHLLLLMVLLMSPILLGGMTL